jgi:hypothetical protein
MPDQVRTPALIERHTPIRAVPFFSVDYVRVEDPVEWTEKREEALILDHPDAARLALALGEHVFATTARIPKQEAAKLPPAVRTASEVHDWRENVPNSGVL